MSEDKTKETTPEEKKEVTEKVAKVEETKEKKVSTEKVEEKKEKKEKKDDGKEEALEEAKILNTGLSSDDELPEEIKKKLEQNKAARAKKKVLKKKKKKVTRKVKSGKAYIKASYNNTIVTLTDQQGNVISWASAGVAGFKGAKKATPYAAQIISKIAVMKAKEEYGLEEVEVFVSGVGTGRESAIRALNANGMEVTAIKDVTPIPHNGCRPKKPRRV